MPLKFSKDNWPAEADKEIIDTKTRGLIRAAISAHLHQAIPPRVQRFEYDGVLNKIGPRIIFDDVLYDLNFEPFTNVPDESDGRLRLSKVRNQAEMYELGPIPDIVREAAALIGHFFLDKENGDHRKAARVIADLAIVKIEVMPDAVFIHTARPGLLIGKKGETIDALSKYMESPVKVFEADAILTHLIPTCPEDI